MENMIGSQGAVSLKRSRLLCITALGLVAFVGLAIAARPASAVVPLSSWCQIAPGTASHPAKKVSRSAIKWTYGNPVKSIDGCRAGPPVTDADNYMAVRYRASSPGSTTGSAAGTRTKKVGGGSYICTPAPCKPLKWTETLQCLSSGYVTPQWFTAKRFLIGNVEGVKFTCEANHRYEDNRGVEYENTCTVLVSAEKRAGRWGWLDAGRVGMTTNASRCKNVGQYPLSGYTANVYRVSIQT